MTTQPTQMMRFPAVMEAVGVSRRTIYRWMDEGHFPQALKIGPNTIAWPAHVIDAWAEEHAAA